MDERTFSLSLQQLKADLEAMASHYHSLLPSIRGRSNPSRPAYLDVTEQAFEYQTPPAPNSIDSSKRIDLQCVANNTYADSNIGGPLQTQKNVFSCNTLPPKSLYLETDDAPGMQYLPAPSTRPLDATQGSCRLVGPRGVYQYRHNRLPTTPWTPNTAVAMEGTTSALPHIPPTGSLPTGPVFWQLLHDMKSDIGGIDERMKAIEMRYDQLEDHIDRLDPNRFTPPESSASDVDAFCKGDRSADNLIDVDGDIAELEGGRTSLTEDSLSARRDTGNSGEDPSAPEARHVLTVFPTIAPASYNEVDVPFFDPAFDKIADQIPYTERHRWTGNIELFVASIRSLKDTYIMNWGLLIKTHLRGSALDWWNACLPCPQFYAYTGPGTIVASERHFGSPEETFLECLREAFSTSHAMRHEVLNKYTVQDAQSGRRILEDYAYNVLQMARSKNISEVESKIMVVRGLDKEVFNVDEWSGLNEEELRTCLELSSITSFLRRLNLMCEGLQQNLRYIKDQKEEIASEDQKQELLAPEERAAANTASPPVLDSTIPSCFTAPTNTGNVRSTDEPSPNVFSALRIGEDALAGTLKPPKSQSRSYFQAEESRAKERLEESHKQNPRHVDQWRKWRDGQPKYTVSEMLDRGFEERASREKIAELSNLTLQDFPVNERVKHAEAGARQALREQQRGGSKRSVIPDKQYGIFDTACQSKPCTVGEDSTAGPNYAAQIIPEAPLRPELRSLGRYPSDAPKAYHAASKPAKSIFPPPPPPRPAHWQPSPPKSSPRNWQQGQPQKPQEQQSRPPPTHQQPKVQVHRAQSMLQLPPRYDPSAELHDPVSARYNPFAGSTWEPCRDRSVRRRGGRTRTYVRDESEEEEMWRAGGGIWDETAC
ncbi:hypothetical protein LTR66_010935 [Elasticomyces elasticus]|nr:hypothetical protein LTR28_000958 [Elasticomyces elasticus]KAK4975638.1 hypothetical protein LTR66_010935 [Elasticomyces elasticus]